MGGFTNPHSDGGIAVLDEGVSLVGRASSIDFRGQIVTGSAIGSAVTETFTGTPGTPVIGETPTGTVGGGNKTFTLAHTPLAGICTVYLNGARQQVTGDYTLVTATITFGVAPTAGSILLVDYYY